ncbi:hypothetical protein DVH05_007543 [Phytophthora capsici]|nr:hypothetical protein DVH05_025891 [Phytophthora capsici]KAG1703599.1 hypothetical protein DVH05_007543 [Phytophthora capsici]
MPIELEEEEEEQEEQEEQEEKEAGDDATKEMPIEPEEEEEEDEGEEADGDEVTKEMPIEPEKEEEIQDINGNIPALLKTSDKLQELTSPKFHFAGAIRDITKGKDNSTVFSLKTVIGQRWTIRVVPSSSSETNDAFDTAKAIAGAEVGNAMLVFWLSSPPLKMIDHKAVTVPMEGEVYGQDIVIYIVKCSSQVLDVEVCQLRHNTDMERLCSVCELLQPSGEELCMCSACKVVNYCSRQCLRLSNHCKFMENESFVLTVKPLRCWMTSS